MRKHQFLPVVFLLLSALLMGAYPLRQIWGEVNLPPLLPQMRLYVGFIYILLAGCYLLMNRSSGQGRLLFGSGYWVVYLGIAAAFCAFYPFFSGDIMDYLMKGRILTIHHNNPYAHIPNEYPGDLMFSLATWKYSPEVYGPVALLLQCIPSLIFPENIRGMIIVYKIISFIFWVSSLFMFVRTLDLSEDIKDRAYCVSAFCFSPLFFISTMMDAHNEVLMIAFSLASIWALLKGRAVLFGALFGLALMIKYPVILMLPYLLAFLYRSGDGSSAGRAGKVVLALSAAALAVTIGYVPFTGNIDMVEQLKAHTGHWFYSNSIPFALQEISGRLGIVLSETFCRNFFKSLFVAVFFAGMIRLMTVRQLTWPLVSKWIFLLYFFGLMHTAAPLQYWYLLWGFPFLIYARWPAKNILIVFYSFAGLFSYSKRMNYLILAAGALYFLWLIIRYSPFFNGRVSGDLQG